MVSTRALIRGPQRLLRGPQQAMQGVLRAAGPPGGPPTGRAAGGENLRDICTNMIYARKPCNKVRLNAPHKPRKGVYHALGCLGEETS